MHIVYKTTNVVNGKYYIGIHQGDGSDNYLGSGILIRHSLKKYGKENFNREILFRIDDINEAYAKEAEVISQHINDGLCMNLTANPHIHYPRENTRSPKLLEAALSNIQKATAAVKGKKKPQWWIDNASRNNPGFSGRLHSEETKKKMSATRKGRSVWNSKSVTINNITYSSKAQARKALKMGKSTLDKLLKG